MLINKVIQSIILFNYCLAQNILNSLDFAAPVFGLIYGTTPEVCYDDLGCFRNDGPFSASEFRPISCVPQSPQIIGTEFLFYRRKFPNDPQIIEALDSHLFSLFDFDPNLLTKIVIHGYKEGPILHGFSHTAFEVIKDGLLFNQDYNVIVVRWTRGASGFYFQSVANTRVVAAQIAQLINYLMTEHKARPQSFHLIGFSLGAHIAGNVGQLVNNLGKISALDPAKPYFDGLPIVARLDSGDALFVESIHTDDGGLYSGMANLTISQEIGTEKSVATVDIYFNGGKKQPGCDLQAVDKLMSGYFLDGILESISCDHKRALDYYVDYLFKTNRACVPIAYRCQSWDQFLSGFCWSCGKNGQNCLIVGLNDKDTAYFRQNRPDNKYFILTNDRQPFCVHQYLLRISTHSSEHTIDGYFEIRLHSYNNTFKDHKSRPFGFSLENVVSLVISSDSPLSDIREIDITFIVTNSGQKERNQIFINSLIMIPLNIIDDNEKITNSVIYCTSGNKWMSNTNNTVLTLRNENCFGNQIKTFVLMNLP